MVVLGGGGYTLKGLTCLFVHVQDFFLFENHFFDFFWFGSGLSRSGIRIWTCKTFRANSRAERFQFAGFQV